MEEELQKLEDEFDLLTSTLKGMPNSAENYGKIWDRRIAVKKLISDLQFELKSAKSTEESDKYDRDTAHLV